MRKILFALIGCFVAICAHAAQVVNVDYVHKLIAQKWDISVPIKTNNIMAAVNMKYLLTAVDVANEILNGEKTTDYGNTEFATLQVADTVATIQAVDTLVRKDNTEKAFFMTVSPECFSDFGIICSFGFSISAAGEFIVDWGDGTVETITKPDTTYRYYNHDYTTNGPYTIKLTGRATAYGTDSVFRVPYDNASWALRAIDGTLGGIFPTLPDGSQPLFKNSFLDASNITSIPSKLFTGISGAPAEQMFESTFSGCSGLTSIPSKLFAGISGAPASYMFSNTFLYCSGLTSIPAGLFAGISGAPASNMFYRTFSDCSGLTSIPENLFGNISGTAQTYMFGSTFYNCTSLIGPSARINGQYLYEIWPDATSSQVGDMYSGAIGLDDYRCIPTAWGGSGQDCDSSSSTPSAPEDAAYDFYLTTTSDTDVFAMQISAAGEFYIDWGDGKTEWVTKPDTTDTTYSHIYATAGAYTIGIGGQATAYNTSTSTAAISFYAGSGYTARITNTKKIASIDGSLGAIFGTLSSDTNNQPRFYETFYNATNMTGSIPSDLFAGISGAPARSMFDSTFEGCSKLTSIPENLFGNISGTAQDSMFSDTFANCTSLTGPSARINGQYLYEIWPSATSSQVDGMYYNATGLSDYLYIPVEWGGLGATTNEYPSAPSDAVYDFYLTTTSDTNVFAMQISAAGEFYINWDDGKSEWITKSDTTNMTFGHKYASKGVYNIRLGGQATAYNTSSTTAAISFSSSASKIASINGSLGAIFGTLSSDTNNQPRFYHTFYNAYNIRGAIPSDLFAGISGAPASSMFSSTFYGCSGLTSIPENLFGNISGTAQPYMFSKTFYNCTSLTGPSARINGQYLYEIWPSATSDQVEEMYYNATKLDDYSNIPTVWR